MNISWLIPVFLVIAINLTPLSGQNKCPEDLLPGRNAVKGWIPKEKPECFDGSKLFEAIDGGAEIQIEYGFVSMARASYTSKKKLLDVEIYRMSYPEAAYGLMTTINEGPPFTPVNGSYTVMKNYYGMVVKGPYYAVVVNPSGKEDLADEINKMIAYISARINEDIVIPEIISTIKTEKIVKAVMFSGDIVLGNNCHLGVSRPFHYEKGVYLETGDSTIIIFQCNKDNISEEIITSTLEDFRKTGKYTVDHKELTLTNTKNVTYKINREGSRIIMSIPKSQ